MSGQRLTLLRRRPTTAKLLLGMFSTLGSLAVAEIALRMVQTKPSDPHQLFCEYHPLLGWQKKPNFSGIHVGPQGIYRIRETMNSKGIRGPEYPYEKLPREFRIVVVGDSTAEGYTVEFENLFSEVLKRRLNTDQTRPVQVINAGTGGYSTDQELLWLTTEGIKYNPDLVILQFCSNDILFNTIDRYWRGYKPLFRIDDGTLELTNVPVPPPLPPDQLTASPLLRVTGWLDNSSYLYRNLMDTLNRSRKITRLLVRAGLMQPGSSTRGRIGPTWESYGNSPVPDYVRFLYWKKATQQERDAGWKITEALLLKFKQQAQAAGSRFLVMIVPGPDEITSRVVSICTQNAIEYINPTARFRDEKTRLKPHRKKLTFAPLDFHWNADGHRLAADVLRDHIVTHDFLSQQPPPRPNPPSRIPFQTNAPTPTSEVGQVDDLPLLFRLKSTSSPVEGDSGGT